MAHDKVAMEKTEDHHESQDHRSKDGQYKQPTCSLRVALFALHWFRCSFKKMSDLSALVQLLHISRKMLSKCNKKWPAAFHSCRLLHAYFGLKFFDGRPDLFDFSQQPGEFLVRHSCLYPDRSK